ncbi:MAG TPA: hypothetical protein VIT92_11640, partial [Burkholderiaceae bacterium]
TRSASRRLAAEPVAEKTAGKVAAIEAPVKAGRSKAAPAKVERAKFAQAKSAPRVAVRKAAAPARNSKMANKTRKS